MSANQILTPQDTSAKEWKFFNHFYRYVYRTDPPHHIVLLPDGGHDIRQMVKCTNPNCKRYIAICRCGYRYKLEDLQQVYSGYSAIERERLLEIPVDLETDKNHDEYCNFCTNSCSQCKGRRGFQPHCSARRSRPQMATGQSEYRLCPSHSRTARAGRGNIRGTPNSW